MEKLIIISKDEIKEAFTCWYEFKKFIHDYLIAVLGPERGIYAYEELDLDQYDEEYILKGDYYKEEDK